MPVFIDGYEIDVATDENHDFSSDITSEPVESGSNITDNIRIIPSTVSLTGIVSDTPIGTLAKRRNPDESNSETALDFLLAIRDSREPVTIETDLRTYSNMAMQKLSVPKSATTGDALNFTATFKEVRIIDTQRVVINVKNPRSKRKVKKGSKSVDTASPTAKTTAIASKRKK